MKNLEANPIFPASATQLDDLLKQYGFLNLKGTADTPPDCTPYSAYHTAVLTQCAVEKASLNLVEFNHVAIRILSKQSRAT